MQIRPVLRRSAYIGLILYKNGLFSYILTEQSMKVGKIWFFDHMTYYYYLGDHVKLKKVPYGFTIFNVELKIGYGGQIARSAGTSVKIVHRLINKYDKILLKFRSGDQYLLNSRCAAILGVCSNPDHWYKSYKKAGLKDCLVFVLMLGELL